jgi:hypothetical protein
MKFGVIILMIGAQVMIKVLELRCWLKVVLKNNGGPVGCSWQCVFVDYSVSTRHHVKIQKGNN